MPGHGNGHGGGEDRALRPLAVALAINTAFFAVEVVGALLANSLALLADAVHMLADSASLGLALFAAWIAGRPADAKRTYGYHRAEVLGALANGVLLLVAVGYVAFDAVRRLGNPQAVDPIIVIGVGTVGLAANLAAAYVLSDRRDLLNVEGAFLHLVADAAGSVAAVLAGVAIQLTGIHLVDPLFALAIVALVVYSARGLLADSLNILLQGAPRGIDVGEVTDALARLDGVEDAHHVHVWALDSNRVALSGHVVVAHGADRDAVLRRCRRSLAEEFGIDHATIQLESEGFAETVDVECYPEDDA